VPSNMKKNSTKWVKKIMSAKWDKKMSTKLEKKILSTKWVEKNYVNKWVKKIWRKLCQQMGYKFKAYLWND
jgi:hypothetical protein